MNRIRVNTKFLATEGIPELITVGMIPFTLLAYFNEWVHGPIETALCAVVFLLCTWSLGYSEWLEVRSKISRLHFCVFCMSFLAVMACGAKLYAMSNTSQMQSLFTLAIVIVPSIMIGVGYNNAIRKAEVYEEKNREHHIAVAGYKALWTVAIFLIAYSVCFLAIFYFGDALSNLFGISRFETWQVAMHNILN